MVYGGYKGVMSRKVLNIREGLRLSVVLSVLFNLLSQRNEIIFRGWMKHIQIKFKVATLKAINNKICIKILDCHFIANI